MARQIFHNQTSNAVSPVFKVKGKIQVDVSGTLAGCDVKTWFKGANNVPTIIRTCSWLSSLGDTLGLPGGNSDGGYDFIEKSEVYFEITNAGGGTNISLQFNADNYEE